MIVLDATALVSLASGHRMLAGLAATSRDEPACIPLLCLHAAHLERPGIAAHAGALPGLDFLPLDFTAMAAVEALTASGVDWTCAHAVYVARADHSAPHGALVLTATPHSYMGTGVDAIDIGKGWDD